jgi:hypothetical protein
MPPNALTLRLARRLEVAWATRDGPAADPEAGWRILEDRLDRVRRARRRLRLAIDTGLRLIVPRLTAEFAARLDEVRRHFEQLRLEYAPTPDRAPDPGEWLAEVRQLEAEFGGVEVRWRDAVVRVVTGPITLRGVALGPFAIEFGWDRVGHISASRCFDPIALEPNPAAGRDEVPHPHVQGVELCAGDATGPLGRALSDGRLADAFLIVRSVLTTYNPQSAYVPLAEWDGAVCSDCGRRVDPEDRYSCEACESDLCESCSGSCTVCSTSRCCGCLESCDVCRTSCCAGCLLKPAGSDRTVCPECRAACARCSATVPRDELTAGSRLCPACDPDEEDDADDDGANDPDPAEVPTDAA